MSRGIRSHRDADHNTIKEKLAATNDMQPRKAEEEAPFSEEVQVPQADFDRLARIKPALKIKNTLQRSGALTKEILQGASAKYWRCLNDRQDWYGLLPDVVASPKSSTGLG